MLPSIYPISPWILFCSILCLFLGELIHCKDNTICNLNNMLLQSMSLFQTLNHMPCIQLNSCTWMTHKHLISKAVFLTLSPNLMMLFSYSCFPLPNKLHLHSWSSQKVGILDPSSLSSTSSSSVHPVISVHPSSNPLSLNPGHLSLEVTVSCNGPPALAFVPPYNPLVS